MKGEIIKWFDKKGYGFISGEDGNSYFLHIKQVSGGQIPEIGNRVKFNAVKTSKGEQAQNVVIV